MKEKKTQISQDMMKLLNVKGVISTSNNISYGCMVDVRRK